MGLVNDLSGRRVYLDTNVFLYAVNGIAPFARLIVEVLDAMSDGKIVGVTSELTFAEVLVTPFRTGDIEQEKQCRAILQPGSGFELVPVRLDILETAARLRAASPALRTPDAIHAATAQLTGCGFFLTNDHRLRVLTGFRVALLSEAATS